MSGPNLAPTSRTISVPGGQERSPTTSVPSSTYTRWSLAWPCRSMTTFGSYRPRTTIRFAFHSRNFSCTDTRLSPCSWAMTSVHGTSSACTKERRGSVVILFLLDVRPGDDPARRDLGADLGAPCLAWRVRGAQG